MPQIEITGRDFERLQRHAEPLVDTSASVITRMIDFFEQNTPLKVEQLVALKEPKRHEFTEENLPRLTHAKFLFGTFGGKSPNKETWGSLVRLALIATFERARNIRDLRRLSGANVVEGVKDDEGYHPVPDFPFSFQGMSAVDTANCIVRCAKALRCEATFEFEWRNKENAHLPGQRGRVRVSG